MDDVVPGRPSMNGSEPSLRIQIYTNKKVDYSFDDGNTWEDHIPFQIWRRCCESSDDDTTELIRMPELEYEGRLCEFPFTRLVVFMANPVVARS